jgi:hypothetical protein
MACLQGCEEPRNTEARSNARANAVADLAHISEISLSEVVDTFVLGSDRTDLQRERLKSQWVGAVVRWEIVVYNIETTGEGYRVTSDQRSSASAAPFLLAVYVTPHGDEDVQRLLKTRTGDRITIVGTIADIRLRSMLILSPARLSP